VGVYRVEREKDDRERSYYLVLSKNEIDDSEREGRKGKSD
jgi:hypothetical protein